jgi:hypothetical protein
MLTLAFFLTCMVVPAWAGSPFGGDDTGFVPSSSAALRCAGKALILASKASANLVRCHMSLALDAFNAQQSGSSEDACETAIGGRLGGSLSKLFAGGACPPCLVAATMTLGDDLVAARDADNGAVFCAGTVPLGDDDTGMVAPDATTLKCELSVAKNLYKLRFCVAKCHYKAAKNAFKARGFDDEACESADPLRSCLAKYNVASDKVASICPRCLDATAQDGLGASATADADAGLGTFFCASPGGAFVD